ncbi:MAG: hypothetical protein LBU12_01495 [Deltaproteobacteria bacterium]|nr:hypothetical protein [Deltaproteobacteria bacterium]
MNEQPLVEAAVGPQGGLQQLTGGLRLDGGQAHAGEQAPPLGRRRSSGRKASTRAARALS